MLDTRVSIDNILNEDGDKKEQQKKLNQKTMQLLGAQEESENPTPPQPKKETPKPVVAAPQKQAEPAAQPVVVPEKKTSLSDGALDVIDEIQKEQGDAPKALKVSDIKPKVESTPQGLQSLISKLKANAKTKLSEPAQAKSEQVKEVAKVQAAPAQPEPTVPAK